MSLNCTVTPRGYEKDVKSDLTLDALCFFRWHSGTRMATRQLSRPPAGAGTGGGPACVPAVGVSTGPWTAGGAAGTPSRAAGVLCQLPPAPAPSRLLASSPVKCEISVKSKHEPSHERGARIQERGRAAASSRVPTTIPATLAPLLLLHHSNTNSISTELPRTRRPW